MMRTKRLSERRHICLVLFIAVLLLSISLVSPAFALQPPEKKVLLLHSYHQGLLWSDDVTTGVKATFEKAGIPVDLYIEYMDAPRLGGEDYEDREEVILRQKFAGIGFDLVICSDEYAFYFMRDRHASLFPGVPAVFCGVNHFDDADMEGWENCTGIVEAYDVDGTLEAALTLDPGVRNVFVVNDATETGISNLQILENTEYRYVDRLNFTYSGNASLYQIEETVGDLPGDTIVLLMTYYREPGGTSYYESADVAVAISAVSAVPVYGVWDIYLGEEGIAGGKIVSGRDQGEAAAAAALRIFDGEPASQIPVQKDLQGRYVFDYRQLKRYGLEASGLPEGSAVINGPSRSLEIDRGVVIAAGFTIAILVLTVLFLVYHIRVRRRSEDALRKSEEKFRHLTEQSFDLIFSADLEGRFIYLSPSLRRICGCEPETLIGKSISVVLDPADHPRLADSTAALIKGEALQGLEFRAYAADGSVRCLEVNAGPVFVDGVVVRLQGVARDITERKETELMKAEAFAQIDRNIEQFATLGDEIRNPLAVIVGIADLYCEEEQTGRILEQAGIIDRIITRLDRGWIDSEKVRDFLRKH